MRALTAITSLIAACVLPSSASARTVLLGRSWQGRPIQAIEVGDPAGTRVLVVGCIHGNETAAIGSRTRWSGCRRTRLDLGSSRPEPGRPRPRHAAERARRRPQPELPGAVAADERRLQSQDRGRCRNARRRIAHALILPSHPHLTVWFHQHLDMVWASGGDRRIEKAFARVSGLPYPPDAAARRQRDLVAEQHAARNDRVRRRAAGRHAVAPQRSSAYVAAVLARRARSLGRDERGEPLDALVDQRLRRRC